MILEPRPAMKLCNVLASILTVCLVATRMAADNEIGFIDTCALYPSYTSVELVGLG